MLHSQHDVIMKILTLNFLTCARKACKSSPSSFPLHPRDAELEIVEVDLNPLFIRNIMPRVEWDALKTITTEVSSTAALHFSMKVTNDSTAQLGLQTLPDVPPEPEQLAPTSTATTEEHTSGDGEVKEEPNQLMKDLHNLLLETTIKEGKLVCGNCEHEYAIKEGIANFLLPSHLV